MFKANDTQFVKNSAFQIPQWIFFLKQGLNLFHCFEPSQSFTFLMFKVTVNCCVNPLHHLHVSFVLAWKHG